MTRRKMRGKCLIDSSWWLLLKRGKEKGGPQRKNFLDLHFCQLWKRKLMRQTAVEYGFWFHICISILPVPWWWGFAFFFSSLIRDSECPTQIHFQRDVGLCSTWVLQRLLLLCSSLSWRPTYKMGPITSFLMIAWPPIYDELGMLLNLKNKPAIRQHLTDTFSLQWKEELLHSLSQQLQMYCWLNG